MSAPAAGREPRAPSIDASASPAQPARRPTIALLLESDGPGGAEVLLLHLATELARRGYRVVPVGPANGVGWLGERLRAEGLEPRTFTLRRAIDPGCVRGLLRLFRTEGVDIVHSHEFSMAVYGGAAARIAGIPHVFTMHGGTAFADRWRRRAALRSIARSSRSIVAVSDATRSHLARVLHLPEERIRVIENGVPAPHGTASRIRRELALAGDEPLLLAVGSLYRVKGHAILLDALARLKDARPHLGWTLAIAGRGEEEAALRRFADEQGIADRCRFLGLRSDVGDLLAAADLFVLPSLSEGLPLALLEAMHAGKAIVASNVGGIPRVVRDGREALLVPAGDAEALSVAIADMLAEPARRTSLGRAARIAAAERYDIHRMTDDYLEAYGVADEARSRSGVG